MRPLRPAARLLVIGPDGRLLLFRFVPDRGAPFWATPGGALDPGESFEAAARRELFEETGMTCPIGPEIARLHVSFTTLEGVEVDAEERYFVARPADCALSSAGYTELERRVMQSHRWWTPEELATHDERWYPESLIELWRGQVR